MIENLLDQLCDVFEDELERQETVLAVCKAQGAAARRHDLEYLEAKTAALATLFEEALEEEAVRLRLVAGLVERFGLPKERQTLSELIAAAPDPWQTRMRVFQDRIRAVMSETQEVVRANERVIRRALGIIDRSIRALDRYFPADESHYTPQGAGRSRRVCGPALIDQKG